MVNAQLNYRPTALVDQNQRATVVSIEDNSASNRVQVSIESLSSPSVSRGANLVVVSSGTVQANIGDSGNVTSVSSGLVGALYQNNQFAFSLNANTVQTAGSGTVAATLDRVLIGSGSGANYLNGTVSKIMYYSRVITTNEAQTLSRQ
jgi:hypothetical protein